MLRLTRGLVVLALFLAVGGGIAAAQTPPSGDPSTTTTSTSTTSTSLGLAPAPTDPLAPTTTSTTQPADPNQPPPDDQTEVGSGEPPPENVVVPPPAAPPPPPANAPVFNAELAKQLKVARKLAGKADKELTALVARADALQLQLATARQVLAGKETEHGAAIARLRAARARLRHRALGAYTGNGMSTLNAILEAGDVNQIVRRSGMVEGVLHRSKEAVKEYEAARKAAGDQINDLLAAIQGAESDLQLLQIDLAAKTLNSRDAHVVVDSLAAGSAIAIKGFVFPVAAPHKFSNDFGNPRMTGTPYEHTHQGNDIFADMGAPLVACERGVVTRVGTDRLGGTKLWLVGQSGARYYYAHLSAYAPGMTEGLVVEAGALLGYVGTTGNAVGTPPHLHFEIHPQGGPAVNPYFLLRAADKVGATAPPPTTGPPASSAPPA